MRGVLVKGKPTLIIRKRRGVGFFVSGPHQGATITEPVDGVRETHHAGEPAGPSSTTEVQEIPMKSTHSIFRELEQKGAIAIVGGMHDIATGRITFFN